MSRQTLIKWKNRYKIICECALEINARKHRLIVGPLLVAFTNLNSFSEITTTLPRQHIKEQQNRIKGDKDGVSRIVNCLQELVTGILSFFTMMLILFQALN